MNGDHMMAIYDARKVVDATIRG